MTSTQRGISRALVVLALSGAGTGIVGAVSVSARADGLPNPAPLPTTDPTTLLPGGVTDPLPLPVATDSPSPQPTDSAATDSGSTTGGGSSTGSSGTDTTAGQAGTGQSTAGQTTAGATTGKGLATATKSTGQHPVASKGVAKTTTPATSAKVPTTTGLDLATTASGLTQAATTANASAPQVGVPAPLTPLLHGLSLPDLPPLPGTGGSSLSAGDTAQPPVVAAPPVSGGTAATSSSAVAAPAYARASNVTPTGRHSPVAPALFALVTAAVAAGVAKIRIRWGTR